MRDTNEEYGRSWVDKSIAYIEKNRLQTFYNLFFMVVLLIMLPSYTTVVDDAIVEVDLPPRGKVVVSNNSANKLYYQLWAEHFTNNNEYVESIQKGKKIKMAHTFSLVDFDYTNVEAKYRRFFEIYRPSKLIKDRHKYTRFIESVEKKMVMQKYNVERIVTKVSPDGAKAVTTIFGVAHQTVSGVEKEPKACEYKIGFERLGGKIYGESLSTTCY